MAGIYIHIPFCKQKCSYCDFHFSTNFSSYRNKMIDAMLKELDLRKNELKNEVIETIYFGGGTPSLLSENEIESFLKAIYKFHHVKDNAEITLEANPDDITNEKALEWKKIGINRLSIGIQSFDDEDLLWMNRAHTASESMSAVKIAQKAGINNISIDLIYGLPNMNESRWTKQLKMALALNVKHISAYCLTIEEKTVLEKLVKIKKLIPAENELQAQHFEILQAEVKKAGFIQYEISNFGLNGYFSQHNSSYWRGNLYQGIGPSAHSFQKNSRSWNVSNNQIYLRQLSDNILPSESDTLSEKDLFNEMLLIGLRTIWGVSLADIKNNKMHSTEFDSAVDKLLNNESAVIQNERLILTEKGMLFADAIAQDLFV